MLLVALPLPRATSRSELNWEDVAGAMNASSDRSWTSSMMMCLSSCSIMAQVRPEGLMRCEDHRAHVDEIHSTGSLKTPGMFATPVGVVQRMHLGDYFWGLGHRA